MGGAACSVAVVESDVAVGRRGFGKKCLFLSRQQSGPDMFAGSGAGEVLTLTLHLERGLTVRDFYVIRTMAAHTGFDRGGRSARNHHASLTEIVESAHHGRMTEMGGKSAREGIFRRSAEARKSDGSVQRHALVTIAVEDAFTLAQI